MMYKIIYEQKEYQIDDKQSILDSLIAQKKDIPFSCKAGTCQSCLMQATYGKIPDKAQAQLKTTLKAQKYFLACQCYPIGDMDIQLPNINETAILGKIISLKPISHNIMCLHVKLDKDFACFPGQYVNLTNSQKISRSYSIANQPKIDRYLEFHIRHIIGGEMSYWVFHEAKIGSELYIRGPIGDCFYTNEHPDAPLLLAGTGTGLAPLIGIIKEALSQNHKGNIQLFHGARKKEDLYFQNILKSFTHKYQNFTYIACILEGQEDDNTQLGSIDDIILSNFQISANLRTYLCGDPTFVNTLKKKIFLAGVASKNIFHDAFLTKAP